MIIFKNSFAADDNDTSGEHTIYHLCRPIIIFSG
jgi:hypothetical protein